MKVFLIVCISAICFESSFAYRDTEECPKDIRDICEAIDVDSPFLNSEQLAEKCTGIIRSLKCISNYIKTCGLEEEAPTFDRYFDFDNIIKVTKEICDENSELGEGYRASFECVKGIADQFGVCFTTTRTTSLLYLQYLTSNGTDITEQKTDQAVCVAITLLKDCIDKNIINSCGITARDTFMEIVHRGIGDKLYFFCNSKEMSFNEDDFLKFLISRTREHEENTAIVDK